VINVDLAAIRARYDWMQATDNVLTEKPSPSAADAAHGAALASARDVPALLAEVKRLCAAYNAIRGGRAEK
jgi:hypothetical protein